MSTSSTEQFSLPLESHSASTYVISDPTLLAQSAPNSKIPEGTEFTGSLSQVSITLEMTATITSPPHTITMK